jgi:hypothetical protein
MSRLSSTMGPLDGNKQRSIKKERKRMKNEESKY